MRILIIRQGAFGDVLCTTPVIRYLKDQGHEIHYLTSARGLKILKNNPNVDKVHYVKEDSTRSDDDLQKMWKDKENEINADKVINFTESIETNIALHPRSPRYNWTKKERRECANRNYYEEMFRWATNHLDEVLPLEGEDDDHFAPEMFYDEEEILEAMKYIRSDNFNILVCLSGSGKNKAYPWMPSVIGDILKDIPEAHIITVGDENCQLLEVQDKRITNLSGKIDIRVSMALTGFVDLVISPDTGVLHASGQYGTPKIGLLGHTTIENITKHFRNDFSIESDARLAECSPCFRLIYSVSIQCPQDTVSHAAYCMSHGIPAETIKKKVIEVYGSRKKDQVCA